MPRRRLHGETQKRRKKPSTRLLKLSESAVRPQSTLQPAPFERSPQVEREDLEFLEAMRELEVERSPWRGESVSRRQAIESVQFLAEEGESALFQRSMAYLGVTPLDGSARNNGKPHPAAPAHHGAAEAPAAPEPPPAPTPAAASPAAPPPPAAPEHTPAPPALPQASPATERVPYEPTEFEAGEDAKALMEALMGGDDLHPELKFAGVSAPPRRPSAGRAGERRGPPEDAEPDDELDLHGKTQEEAIAMVQNFLLSCHRRRFRHVLIITGQGHNSGAGGPVLKEAVYRWLDLNGRRFARRFERAPGRLGGAGAIWVTLK